MMTGVTEFINYIH